MADRTSLRTTCLERNGCIIECIDHIAELRPW
jgi:hypothetical protein